MSQNALPASDATVVAQTSPLSVEMTTEPWFSDINETTTPDLSAIVGTVQTVGGENLCVAVVKLGTVIDPEASDNHVLKARAKVSGTSDASHDLDIFLYQGDPVLSALGVATSGTLIATLTKASSDLTASFVEYTVTLSSGEADNITDYADLHIFVRGGAGNGAVSTTYHVSQAFLEVGDQPDIPESATLNDNVTENATPRAGQKNFPCQPIRDVPMFKSTGGRRVGVAINYTIPAAHMMALYRGFDTTFANAAIVGVTMKSLGTIIDKFCLKPGSCAYYWLRVFNPSVPEWGEPYPVDPASDGVTPGQICTPNRVSSDGPNWGIPGKNPDVPGWTEDDPTNDDSTNDEITPDVSGDGDPIPGTPVDVQPPAMLYRPHDTLKFTLLPFSSIAGESQHNTPQLWWGTGTPEGVIYAPLGSWFLRTDGGASTTWYVKETEAFSTFSNFTEGWVGK